MEGCQLFSASYIRMISRLCYCLLRSRHHAARYTESLLIAYIRAIWPGFSVTFAHEKRLVEYYRIAATIARSITYAARVPATFRSASTSPADAA